MKSSNFSESEYLNKLLEIICSVFDAYSVVLFLHYNKSQYRLTASFSLGDSIQKGCLIESGQGLTGWIIHNNQPLLVNDFVRQKAWLGYYSQSEEYTIKAFMGCPLDEGQGVLCLDSKKMYAFGPKEQKIFHQFAQLISVLRQDISQKYINKQEHDYYTCLQVIRELRNKYPKWTTFLDYFLKLLSDYAKFDYCFFTTRDERGEGFYIEGWNQPIFKTLDQHNKKFNIDSGLIGWIFRNNSYVSTADDKNNAIRIPMFEKKLKTPIFRSFICLPIIVHMRTRGVLVLANKENKTISQELKNFLFLVTEHLALFLENLYLKNRLRQVLDFGRDNQNE